MNDEFPRKAISLIETDHILSDQNDDLDWTHVLPRKGLPIINIDISRYAIFFLVAASIVTDALLLLAGSPQKALSNSSSQSCCSASDPTAKKHTPVTPPKVSDATKKTRNAVNENEHSGHSSQPALITSTLPYVRALNFPLTNADNLMINICTVVREICVTVVSIMAIEKGEN